MTLVHYLTIFLIFYQKLLLPLQAYEIYSNHPRPLCIDAFSGQAELFKEYMNK